MTAGGKEWPEKGVPVREVKERWQSAQRYTCVPRRSRPFLTRFCFPQCGDLVAALQATNQVRRFYGSHFQRARHSKEVIPILLDQFTLQVMSRNSIEHSIAGALVNPPISRIAEIGQPRTELEPQQPEQP